jgi:hypothetical protein
LRPNQLEDHQPAAHLERPRTGLEHLQHAQALLARSARRPALDHAFDEVAALAKERFLGIERDRLTDGLLDLYAIPRELDLLVEELDPAIGAGVLENEHLPVAYYNQAVLLIRMKPTDKDMRAPPVIE